ncbi:hypothetical protein SRABI106_04582 [Rahnella aquatilis]|nr:hypothetical protein SRABI106_04582 [Rahnella aquatilis]
MRLLYFIKQHDGVRMFNHRIRQQTALIKTDISRRRTDQTADRMTFHVFRHIKTQQFDIHRFRQLNRHFGFPHPGWTGEQERTDRLVILTQTGAAHLDRFGQCFNSRILSEDQHFQAVAQTFQDITVCRRHSFFRNAGNTRYDTFDIADIHGFLAFADRH